MSKNNKKSGDPRKRSLKISEFERGVYSIRSMFVNYENPNSSEVSPIVTNDSRIKRILNNYYENNKSNSFIILCENDTGFTCISFIFDLHWYNPQIKITYHFSKEHHEVWIVNKWIPENYYLPEIIKGIIENYDSWSFIQFN